MAENKNNRVVVAMSGGVDSSLTAALLLEAGYEVIGVHMRLHHLHAQSRAAGASGRLNKGCCSADDVDDARMVCYELGIPFYVLDFKFDSLLRRAAQLGADHLATGHYGRITYDEATGKYSLRKALDPAKDQSYVLYHLG